MQLPQCTASLPGVSGQWDSYYALPHCLAAVAVEPLQCTASLPGGTDQLDSCGVVWCGVVWCGVVWCGVVWCGVVWCGVVCRRRCYQMAKGRDVYPRAKVNGLGCVCCVRVVCGYVVLGRRVGEAGKTRRAPPWRPSLSQELPLHPLSFRLLVQA